MLKLYEYQTKMHFKRYQIPIPKGVLVNTLDEARQVVDQFGDYVIVKPQSTNITEPIRIAHNAQDAFHIIEHIFRSNFSSMTIRNILIERGIDTQIKIYLIIQTDSSTGHIKLRVTAHQENKSNTIEQPINPSLGLRNYQVRDIAGDVELPREHWREFTRIIKALYQCYIDSDAQTLEIHPLALNSQNAFIALNAHMTIDQNALYRHPEFLMIESRDHQTDSQQKAAQANISYVPMDGQVACIANGAGLCMATMDIVDMYGGGNITPACFMDIGVSAHADHINNALRLALSETHIKSILVNVFGGITPCTDIANNLISTYEGNPPQKQIVVRLSGPNEEAGMVLIEQAQIPHVHTSLNLPEAVRLAIKAARKETYGYTR